MKERNVVYAVIMAGGTGTRFWPESRRANPKQLLKLAGPRSMIQSTMDRLAGLCDPQHCLIVTNRQLVDAIGRQLPEIPLAQLIGEPCKRDTAPCIGLAAHWVTRRDPQGIMLVLPADHVIQAQSEFQDAVRRGVALLEADPTRIVTFGIPPTYPADAFGYIERDPSSRGTDPGVFRVRRFREKPDRKTAAQFLQTGGYYWNAGIFLWRADTILSALRRFEPSMSDHLERIGQAIGSEQFNPIFEREFAAIGGKSIDYAVLEQFENVWMIEAPFDWDDVGNWSSLPRLIGGDDQGNTIQATHVGIDTHNSIVRGTAGHLIVTVGLADCIVVQTHDATLIANRNDEEKLRQVVKTLGEQGFDAYL
jgi:mannose-1-phosphate guanylyltransferase